MSLRVRVLIFLLVLLALDLSHLKEPWGLVVAISTYLVIIFPKIDRG